MLEVAIVGAGVCGLTLGRELAARGVSFALFDTYTSVYARVQESILYFVSNSGAGHSRSELLQGRRWRRRCTHIIMNSYQTKDDNGQHGIEHELFE